MAMHKVDHFAFCHLAVDVLRVGDTVRGGGKPFLEGYPVIGGRCHLSQSYDIKKKKKCMKDLT